MDELVVQPHARSKGTGALMLGEAIRRAGDHGCAEISLSVMASNAETLRFYRRHGFEDEALLLEHHFPAAGT